MSQGSKREPLDTLERHRSRQYRKKKKTAGSKRSFGPVGWALFCVAVVSVTLVAGRLWHYHKARQEYEGYRRQAAQQSPEWQAVDEANVQAELSVNDSLQERITRLEGGVVQITVPMIASAWAETYENEFLEQLVIQNSDTVAWLDIKRTTIQYPVVRTYNNIYYMNHSFNRKVSDSGAIFMDCGSSGTFTDFNTVIYGHNMKDGSMFATLDKYEKQSFADKHLDIQVQLADRWLSYRVFACYVCKGEEDFDFRARNALGKADKRAFLKAVEKRNALYTRQEVNDTDRLLTLVTCTDGHEAWHFVVHAVLVHEDMNPK